MAPVLDEFVGAEALLALLAVHQGIGEAGQMAAGLSLIHISSDPGASPESIEQSITRPVEQSMATLDKIKTCLLYTSRCV